MRMKKIGQGWQYSVYDLGNGRVRKVKPFVAAQYHFIRSSNKRKGRPYSFFIVVSAMQEVHQRALKANAYIRKILPVSGGEMFGNPTFLNDLEYEQDKVVNLGEFFSGCSTADGKQVIDGYITLIQRMWSFGCSDMMFNFIDNSGIDHKGRIVEIDFGELRLSKADVSRDIREKRWLQVSPYERFPKGELKDYYRASMNSSLTIERLDAAWGSGLL